jgi:ketosteroid isomerase-like protein
LSEEAMNGTDAVPFDFPAFKRACTTQDLAAWIAFFADDAQWIEYRPGHPPASPRVLSGRGQIAQFLVRVKGSNITLAIEDEVVGPTRAAFRAWITLPDGKRIVEQVILHHSRGRITRQVDVEASDP